MERLKDHDIRLISNDFLNGPPAKLFNQWLAWGIKNATSYNVGSTILQFLQLIDLSHSTAAPRLNYRSGNEDLKSLNVTLPVQGVVYLHIKIFGFLTSLSSLSPILSWIVSSLSSRHFGLGFVEKSME